MMRPWEIYLEWFDGIPENLQREIAFNALSRTPDIDRFVDFDERELIEEFRGWLRGDKADGKILIVREVTDSMDLGQHRNAYHAVRKPHLATEALNRWILADATRDVDGKIEKLS